MAILGMNHFTILSADLDATLAFYGDVLGLHSGRRPPFDFPGAWLYSGDTAVLHVIAGRPLPAEPAGVIRFDLRRLVGDGTWQLFCHDPNGARVELDFDAAEPPPPGFAD
jgi:catechol 2,3-dioxygenase-like lactoylglutathione lyase family enzyme